jgi:tetratricopeptide (TPR) repeat protein
MRNSDYALLIFATVAVLATPVTALPQAAKSESVRALMQLARMQVQQGNQPAALDSLRKARTLAPNSEEVLSAFAQIAMNARAITPAVLALESLVWMCPDVAQYQHMLGIALMHAGDMPAALDALRRAETLEPNRPSTLLALGAVLNDRNQYGDAQAVLMRALDLEADNLEATVALAEAEEAQGDLAASETRIRRVLDRSPAHSGAQLVLGMVLLKQERYAEARDMLQKSITANPRSPKAHYQISLAYARLGDEANAKKHQELYKQRLRETEQRLRELRARTGAAESAR